ncbi:putative mitochondrial fission protein [Ustulina deusta]|nr:putative mitochondrial fission protein [Ustulina deusta]KAI3327465.1 putative mitochondrial fission protein [Ustulina deusta]KAI3339088.1 putative mitochondrial fission protein [Ustulina deusta]
MSQQYFSGRCKKMPQAQDTDDQRNVQAQQSSSSHQPYFMTIGNSSGSENIVRLQSLLGDDLGYNEGNNSDKVDPPSPYPLELAMQPDWPEDTAISQVRHNQHRLALARSISRVIKLLNCLQETNITWPAYYPSVQPAERLSRASSRSGTVHTYAPSSSPTTPSPMLPRANIVSEGTSEAESSKAAENRAATTEPRLVTPQIEHDFSILKLDLKLGMLHQAELVHSLDRKSLALLLDGKISTSIRHLHSLRDRIEDTSSKVLITGDLNAGKSTFCNALLRRKVLPEDQQPCTAIFCEVLDAKKNIGRQEVHAIYKHAIYNCNNEFTYEVFDLKDLKKDIRTVDQSLLNNGIVDIALIDAPGLNSDTTKTTAIFARQEEIDVVVFVVAAANYFTLTAQEFIWSAAAEKDHFFIVINGYNTIEDKERCREMILKQVRNLSPATSKEAGLIHFVSSKAIPTTRLPSHGPAGNSGNSSSGGGDGDPDDFDSKGKGKDIDEIRNFENLEQSLRRFVLDKRAKSKLAPAKTYLLNILNDIHVLAAVNSDMARSERDRMISEMLSLEPRLESSERACSKVRDELDRTIEGIHNDIYDHVRTELNSSIANLGNINYVVPYNGPLSAFQYAEALKEAMLSHVADSVTRCEEHARSQTIKGVNIMKQLGILHLGDEYDSLNFRPEVMFRRKRDALAQKVAGTGIALTVATAFGSRMVGMHDGLINHAFDAAKFLGNNNLRRLVIPGVIVAAIVAAAYAVNQIPKSLPHRLSSRVSCQLSAIDYVHTNASRISGSAHKVLCFPADNLRGALEQSARDLRRRRDETLCNKSDREVALQSFGSLVHDSTKQRAIVEAIDINTPATEAGTVQSN